MKNNLPGPSSYNLPDLMGGGSKLSTLRSTPAASFGIKPAKQSYHADCYKDFIGSDSPPLTKYNPEAVTINKSRAPRCAESKF